MLVSLPAAYALQAQGWRVNVFNGRQPIWWKHLPTYERLEELPGSKVLDFWARGVPRMPWTGRASLVDFIAKQCGMEITETPRAPWLRKPPPLEVREPYVVVAIEGAFRGKYLTPEQMAAAATVLPAIATHWAPREVPRTLENRTGQTRPEELLALVANARAVVSCDTGILHLAAAFGVPVVAVVSPQTINPPVLAADWQPSIWLSARRTDSLAPALVAKALRLALETEPAQLKRKQTGPAWWQSAEVRGRMATAAEHQRQINARLAAGELES